MNITLKKLTLFLFVAIVLMGCGPKYEGDFSYEIEDFTFINQDGGEVSKSDFEGKFWIADFIYTNCQTECPQMVYNKQKVERALDEAGIDDVEFVSFSVDPDTDTPEALKEYGEVRGITFDNWTFLTGYDFERVQELAENSFNTAVMQNEDSLMHAVTFYLVSPEGNAIKSYNGYLLDEEQINQIVEDIKSMH